MAETTKIQWCHHTFNPWRGCAKVNAGCANCYAERESKRFPKNRGTWGADGTRVKAAEATWSVPIKWNAAARAAGERRRVFCASLADVFEDWLGRIHDHDGHLLYRCSQCGQNWKHGAIHRELCACVGLRGDWRDYRHHPINWLTMNELRRDLFALIDRTPALDWLLVTKRPERICEFWEPVIRTNANGAEVHDHTTPLYRSNVWLLTSVSDQATADEFVPRLLECRDLVPVLGVSAEPLLGPIDFTDWIGCECSASLGHCMKCLDGSLDWIILGGESGTNARTCDVAWLGYGLTQCEQAGVACFIKQYGSAPVASRGPLALKDSKGGDPSEWLPHTRVRQFPETATQGVVA